MGAGGSPLAALVLPRCFIPSWRWVPTEVGLPLGLLCQPHAPYSAEVCSWPALVKGSRLPGCALFSPPSLSSGLLLFARAFVPAVPECLAPFLPALYLPAWL